MQKSIFSKIFIRSLIIYDPVGIIPFIIKIRYGIIERKGSINGLL